MRSGLRFLSVLFPTLILAACALPSREGPPAPVVQVTPRSAAPSAATPAQPAPEPKPAEPPKPEKKETQVYAYRDPGAPPEPAQPESPAQASQGTPSSPTAPVSETPKAAARTPAPESAPAQPAVAKAEPPKPKPKPKPPIMPQPSSEAPTPPMQVASAEPAPAPLPASNVAAPSLAPAARALANQAEQQRQAGDYAGAAASLERSLRIAPREAYLWNRLARVRMEQGQAVQAGNLASRSNDLAGGDADVKRDNWRMIAEAKRRAGDAAGASAAEQRANAN
ncbi:tetratricopeptide repeat protein [Thiorhodococcus drewsii]|uniref:tetratricopeptide repeat protein n=1 Tax=Thiorhodococcus drewsii TaxID=210408 RepID=UPI0002F0BDDB|nr:tetratricopeptide repeat protein [Thiorhodococcus drewsii]